MTTLPCITYVGLAPFHKQGVLHYNPKTYQTIVKRSFQQLNHKDNDIPQLSLLVSHDKQTMPNLSPSNTLENQNQTDNVDYLTDPDSNLSTTLTIHLPDTNHSQHPISQFATVPTPSASTLHNASSHKPHMIMPQLAPYLCPLQSLRYLR